MILDSLPHVRQRHVQAIDKIPILFVATILHILNLQEVLDATAEVVQRGVVLEHETSFSEMEISPQQSELLKVTVLSMQNGVERIFSRLRFGKVGHEIATLFAPLSLACAKRRAKRWLPVST